MKRFFTTPEIIEAAERNNLTCTFASVNLRVFQGWNRKGRKVEIKFHRVEPCVWEKKVVRG